MKNIPNPDLVKRIIHWSFLIVTVIYLVTGFGISEFRTVEALSFGLLTKSLAFKIHYSLWIPFIVFLGLHIYFASIKKRTKVAPR